MDQPGMARLFVVDPAVFDSVSKFCAYGLPSVVRLTHCACASGTSAATAITTKAMRRMVFMSSPDFGPDWRTRAWCGRAQTQRPLHTTPTQARRADQPLKLVGKIRITCAESKQRNAGRARENPSPQFATV